MTIWAFACKNESSLNRWFDDDEVIPVDTVEKDWEKNLSDSVVMEEAKSIEFQKNIGLPVINLFAAMFNVIMFNDQHSANVNFEDAVIMQDSIEITIT